jgi:hypothetical protein
MSTAAERRVRADPASDVQPPTMLPDETVVPLTNLPTAHPSEESAPVTPVVAPASQDTPDHAEGDRERSSTAEGGSPPG